MAAAKGKGAAEDKPLSSPTISSSNNPFIFWFYFTASVALITTLFIPISSLFFSSSADEERSWFLALPDDLRHHYSSGRTVKVEVGASRSPAEVFAVEYGPRDGSETVVLIHGFGSSSFSFRRLLPALAAKGLRAVAIDLPGSGFSDKYVDVEEEVESPGGIWGVYYDIKEKGLFWGFDQLIETGQIPFNGEEAIHVHKRKVRKSIVGDEVELGRVIRQVVDSLRLAPVHLVLHDTGVVPGAVWAAAEDRGGAVRSVTVVDGAAAPALPMWAVEVPVVREMVLGVPIFYFGLLRWCCSRSIDWAAAEAHRVLLKGKGGRSAAVAVGRSLNASFELREWARSEKVRNLPVQVLWSQSWSREWTEEGRRVVSEFKQAKFVEHSGGRWCQEDAVEELSEQIAEFVHSLPKSVRPKEEEPIPDDVKKLLEEASSGDDNHHHSHHHIPRQPGVGHDHHDHTHGTGYMDAYGLGHGWGAH